MESSGLTGSLLTAVTSGAATQSTVGKICHLLHHERGPTLDKPVNRLQSGRVARSTSAKPSHTTSTDCKLSDSQARAFATELATAGAKKLAQARTSQTANSRDALRPSSGNASPGKSSNHSKSTTAFQATNAVIAECTHLALQYLMSCVNDKTRWRLLEASLALVRQLLALKLRDLANAELRACQLLFSAGSTASHQPLLQVELPDTTDAVPLRLALVYQTLIVKAAALTGHPEVINALAKCLQSPGHLPHAIAKRFVDSSSDSGKAAVYLEAISADLLAMCPRLSDSADGTATDPRCSPSPEAVFAIQTYALQLRRIWWHLAKHEIDRAKALSEQFLKITRTYMRRCASQSDGHVLETVSKAYVAIFDEASDRIPASQDVRKLTQGANSGRGPPHTSNNTHGAQSDSVRSDLAQLTVDAKALASATGADIDERLERFAVSVNEQRTGDKKSFANLTIELSRLIRKQCAGKTATLSRSRTILAQAVVDFVSWTESVYPGLETRSQQSILLSVLRAVPRRQAASWMSINIAAVASRGDVLQDLAEAARSVNITAAFQISPAAILLGEVLDLLVLHLSTGASTVEITALMEPLIESVSPLQKGIILEWLLRACLKSGGSRSACALKQLSEQCIQRLYMLYDAQKHPLRRTVVNLQASVALSKGLIDRDLAKRQDLTESNDCGQDVAMQSSVTELRACERTCHAFECEQEDLEAIRNATRAWQQLFLKGVAVDLYNRECSTKLLESLLSFCQARGLSDEAVEVSRQLMRISEQDDTRHARALTTHCEARLCNAASISEYVQQLQRYAGDDNLDNLSRTSCWVILAETYLANGDLDEAESVLALTNGISGTISGSSKTEQALLCARAWRVHACICMAQGQLSSAVAAAKTAVSVTNALWQALEQRSTPTKTEDDSEINSIAEISSKISKLQLKPAGPMAANTRDCGRAFWNLLPLASATLTTLADVYVHAGLFAEAKHHLVKLVEMTETIPGSLLVLMARTKLAELLILAGKTEEAELCLAKVECPAYARDREVAMQMHRAQALLHAKLGEDEDALASLEKAITIAKRLSQQATQAIDAEEKTFRPKKSTPSKTGRRGLTKKTVKVKSDGIDASAMTSHALEALQIERARLQLKLGIQLEHTDPVSITPMTSAQRQMQHLSAMASLEKDMQTHVVFNALHESTLVWPALESIGQTRTATTGKTRLDKGRKLKTAAPQADDEPLSRTLAAARSVLAETVSDAEPLTAVHHETRMLLDSGIYAASSTLAQSVVGQQSDLTRLTGAAASLAKRREVQTILQGSHDASSSAKLQWPAKTTRDCNNVATPDLASSLPKSWTAVELMLNENHSALIAVRHRRGQDSLVVRLPFARQDMDDQEDRPFDFEAGRAELKDIIEQSNRICHVGNDSSNRMTSTTWWREREDLDRRLQELLTNIQEIWFGGFKGILCPSTKRQSELVNFRKEFEAILARHVPVGKNAHLSDSMLLLFLDLLHDQTEDLDVDHAVLDLWYGVIDALRFNGYELAYDELDFDSLTVETIDALQNLHDGDEGDAHLILVLDKRLHNFPWESMPYLSHTSVSRMADIHSLQARLAGVENQYCLKPSHGSVILDPSSDMKRTQQTLEPVLHNLRSQHPAWTVMSGKKPTEAEFEQVLQTSDLLMYFGHGAGSQYIRPRTIKKLEACSKVVWLMGCSSGEVLEHDELEPASVPAAYLLAADAGPSKCMAIVANLWDVTDKDIDRFSIAMGEDWGLWDGGEVEKPATKSRARPGLQTPPGSPKTPKIPKARANTVDRSAPPRMRAAAPCNLAQAVSNSRDACYLRYLNGAAPVVYGLPVLLG